MPNENIGQSRVEQLKKQHYELIKIHVAHEKYLYLTSLIGIEMRSSYMHSLNWSSPFMI